MKNEALAGQGVVRIVAGNVSAPSRREYVENRHCGDQQQPAEINRITQQRCLYSFREVAKGCQGFSALRRQLVFVHGHEGHERLGDRGLLIPFLIKDLRLADDNLKTLSNDS